jgi:hypothetical protein
MGERFISPTETLQGRVKIAVLYDRRETNFWMFVNDVRDSN